MPRRKIPRSQWPAGIAAEYSRALIALLKSMWQITQQLWEARWKPLIEREYRVRAGMRGDELADDLRKSLEQHETEVVIPAGVIEGIAKEVAEKVLAFSRRQFDLQVRAVLAVNPFAESQTLQQVMQLFIAENVSLIKSIPQEYHKQVQRIVTEGATRGKATAEVAGELEAAYNLTRNRARLIARDQIAKMNGDMTKVRHEGAGLRRFKWRTSMDERVRGNPTGRYPRAIPSHWAREGKIYTWAEGADGEYPGSPIQCRCTAEVVEEDLIALWEGR